MKIATWNVNGIRARASSFESWLRRSNPDVLCLQEIKAHPDQIPTGIREIDGYSSYWHGAKGGYSGVSIHVRTSSLGESSLTIPHFDEETRVMQVSAGGLTIINVYTPLGQRSYEQKLGFLESLVRYVDVLQADGERIVLCGDLNIAHEDRDIHPEMYEEGMLCTRSEERAKIDALRDMGLVDLFRRDFIITKFLLRNLRNFRIIQFHKDRSLFTDMVEALVDNDSPEPGSRCTLPAERR